MKKIIIILLAFFIIGISVVLIGAYLNSPLDKDNSKHKIEKAFEVKSKESLAMISSRLARTQLIRSKQFFFYYGKLLLYKGYKIQKGKYLLSSNMSSSYILDKLIYGKIIEEKIVLTIPEGYNIYDIAKIMLDLKIIKKKEEFLSLTSNTKILQQFNIKASTMEGYLYPTTYFISPKESILNLTMRMLKTFDDFFPTEDFEKVRGKLNLNKHEIITLASLIEKETGVEHERQIVSSVYHNRLNKNMRLECDPTVIYALIKANKYKGKLSRKRGDLSIKSPYNTYLYKNLPPSPIANPSRKSILAALYPHKSKYIFFVARNDKSHLFSNSWKGHLKNIEKYKRWLANSRKKKRRKAE